MDFEHQDAKKERQLKELRGDQFYSNRYDLTRDSSVGHSSRIYYYRNPEGVPFKWEMQPGTPKDPPKVEVVPPLSPPPAMLSLSLPRPNIPNKQAHDAKPSRLKFWKKHKKDQPRKAVLGRDDSKRSNDYLADNSNEFKNFNCYGSDRELTASSRYNSVSPTSSSVSCSSDPYLHPSRKQIPPRSSQNTAFTCGPQNISTILVKFMKKT